MKHVLCLDFVFGSVVAANIYLNFVIEMVECMEKLTNEMLNYIVRVSPSLSLPCDRPLFVRVCRKFKLNAIFRRVARCLNTYGFGRCARQMPVLI